MRNKGHNNKIAKIDTSARYIIRFVRSIGG